MAKQKQDKKHQIIDQHFQSKF